MKGFLFGAGVAAVAGMALGSAFREPILPQGGVGQQQLISSPQARGPNAFDSWAPIDGAPPPYMEQADWTPPSDQADLAFADAPPGDPLDAVSDPAPAPYEVAAADLPPPNAPDWTPGGQDVGQGDRLLANQPVAAGDR